MSVGTIASACDGDRAAAARLVADDVEDAAERHQAPSAIVVTGGQLVDLPLQPAGMAVEEPARLVERAALRHGEHRRARRAGNAERVVPRARVAAQVDRHHAARGRDLKRIGDGLRGPAGEEAHAGNGSGESVDGAIIARVESVGV